MSDDRIGKRFGQRMERMQRMNETDTG